MIDREELLRIAALAKLSFPEESLEQFRAEFERIVEYVGVLNRIEALQNVEPLDHVVEHTNALAEDAPHTPLSPEDALANAPRRLENFFKVPKVIAAE